MIKCIVIGNFRGTYLPVEMFKGNMLIFRIAEGVQGKRKVGNPWPITTLFLRSRQNPYLLRALEFGYNDLGLSVTSHIAWFFVSPRRIFRSCITTIQARL